MGFRGKFADKDPTGSGDRGDTAATITESDHGLQLSTPPQSSHELERVEGLVVVLEAESPVAGSVGVPLGQRRHPALEPWALDNEVGDGGGRHYGCQESQLARMSRGFREG